MARRQCLALHTCSFCSTITQNNSQLSFKSHHYCAMLTIPTAPVVDGETGWMSYIMFKTQYLQVYIQPSRATRFPSTYSLWILQFVYNMLMATGHAVKLIYTSGRSKILFRGQAREASLLSLLLPSSSSLPSQFFLPLPSIPIPYHSPSIRFFPLLPSFLLSPFSDPPHLSPLQNGPKSS